jgi:hypothetical protein
MDIWYQVLILIFAVFTGGLLFIRWVEKGQEEAKQDAKAE